MEEAGGRNAIRVEKREQALDTTAMRHSTIRPALGVQGGTARGVSSIQVREGLADVILRRSTRPRARQQAYFRLTKVGIQVPFIEWPQSVRPQREVAGVKAVQLTATYDAAPTQGRKEGAAFTQVTLPGADAIACEKTVPLTDRRAIRIEVSTEQSRTAFYEGDRDVGKILVESFSHGDACWPGADDDHIERTRH